MSKGVATEHRLAHSLTPEDAEGWAASSRTTGGDGGLRFEDLAVLVINFTATRDFILMNAFAMFRLGDGWLAPRRAPAPLPA